MEEKLGKIKSVYFGLGGYQGAQLGLHFELGGDGWGVCSSNAFWDVETIECSNHARWTEQERAVNHDSIMRHVSKLLSEGKVNKVEDLKGTPVQCLFDGNVLKDWRILTEVI